MKISQKLVLLFLFNGLIPTLAIGGFAYFNTQRALNRQIQVQLHNTLVRQSDKVDAVVAANVNTITLFSLREQMRLILDDYTHTHSKADLQQLNTLLTAYQHDNRSLRRIHLLDTKGTVLSSSDPRLIGKSYVGTSVFAKGSADIDVSLFFKDIDGVLGQYLTAPVFQGGHQIGVAIIENQVDSFLQITGDYTDTGKTGETFLASPARASQQAHYLTPLRFNHDAALTPYRAGKGGAIKDYRNHPVLQLSDTIDSTNWTIGVKMDQAEVYAPVYQLRNLTIVGVVVIAVAMALLGWYFPRGLSRRLTRVTAIATRIRDGNLNERVQVDSRDEIGTLSTAFNDMTTSLLESKARLMASILSLSQGFVMASPDGTVITINDAARRLLKAPADNASTAPTMQKLFAKLEKINISQYVAECLEQKKTTEARDVMFEGSFFNIFLSPIMLDGQVRGVVILISDETEERIIQRSRDEFFSIASHELRTPLTAIRGNTAMMLDYYKEQLKDPDLHTMVNDAYEASVRLIDVVNDFLDMSSLEQGKAAFTTAPFDIEAAAGDAIDGLKKDAVAKKLALKIEPSKLALPPVMADRDRVRQILASLLDNAIKFTESGVITISFEPTATTMRIHVADPGRGISPEAQKLLFHKFQQATSSILTRDNTSATGLGLYIGRLLAQSMGGTLNMAHTKVGKGTTFTLELPTVEVTGTAVTTGAELAPTKVRL